MTDTIDQARRKVEQVKHKIGCAESAKASAKYKEQEAYEDFNKAEELHNEALDELEVAEKELAEALEKGD